MRGPAESQAWASPGVHPLLLHSSRGPQEGVPTGCGPCGSPLCSRCMALRDTCQPYGSVVQPEELASGRGRPRNAATPVPARGLPASRTDKITVVCDPASLQDSAMAAPADGHSPQHGSRPAGWDSPLTAAGPVPGGEALGRVNVLVVLLLRRSRGWGHRERCHGRVSRGHCRPQR